MPLFGQGISDQSSAKQSDAVEFTTTGDGREQPRDPARCPVTVERRHLGSSESLRVKIFLVVAQGKWHPTSPEQRGRITDHVYNRASRYFVDLCAAPLISGRHPKVEIDMQWETDLLAYKLPQRAAGDTAYQFST